VETIKSRIAARLSVRTKLIGVSAVLLCLMGVIGLLAISSLGSMSDQTSLLYDRATTGIATLGKVDVALVDKARLITYGVVVGKGDAAQAKIDSQIAADDTVISDGLAAFEALDLDAADMDGLAKFKTSMAQYQTAADGLRSQSKAGETAAAAAAIPAAAAIRTQMMADLTALQDRSDQIAVTIDAAADGTYQQGRTVTIGVLALSVAIGLFLSIYLARYFTRNVKAVQSTLSSMADNCATALAGGLGAFAANDLTVAVHPATSPIEKYGSDEIGQTAAVTNKMLAKLTETMASYETARAGLAGMLGEVKLAADSVSRTSSDLNNAAGQSGNASSQIAQTINQVASGASEQARAASDTSNAAVELGGIISQVSKGAAATSTKVEAASTALAQMATSIASASAASAEVKTVAQTAAQAAERGRGAVRQTVQEMDRIKVTVEQASVSVTELGAKSDQIGAIVETIDDIAEQTNLLALNAAIEAARAGEQGKGFAVVADEVRKLAERSSRATKEIAALIAEVQTGTDQAVQAMHAGAVEVEQGSALAGQAGRSLDDISDAVAATEAAVGRITSAVDDMDAASRGVVAASDAIAVIAAETNSAGARMTESSETVSRSVQAIAAISEENSASAEEVSAATEEMSAQAEEVVASAESLASMAANLEALVARFRIQADENELASRLETFRKAHLGWVSRLDRMIAGKENIAESEAASSHDCALGKWYYGPAQATFGRDGDFLAIETPHTHFHESCRAAVVAHARGDARTASSGVEAARRASTEVVARLEALERSAAGGRGSVRSLSDRDLDRAARTRAA
jgi:methyl-accepting chemotaxis protein